MLIVAGTFHSLTSKIQPWCTVPGRPTILITVGQGPTALAVGAGGGCLDIFTLICPFFPLSPSLWETARYRLKYCLKGLLNPKPTNQPTTVVHIFWALENLILMLLWPFAFAELIFMFRQGTINRESYLRGLIMHS